MTIGEYENTSKPKKRYYINVFELMTLAVLVGLMLLTAGNISMGDPVTWQAVQTVNDMTALDSTLNSAFGNVDGLIEGDLFPEQSGQPFCFKDCTLIGD